MQRNLIAVFFAILLACCGCENNLSPKGVYQKQLVVYGVLSNRSDSQYVRVYTTYNLSGFDPAEHTTDTGVRGARVTMTDDSTTYNLRETVIPRDDTSRYSSNLVGYLAFPSPARLGKTYSLSIISDQGNVTATATVPERGYVAFSTPYLLKTPDNYDEDIVVSFGLSSLAQGYIIRLYLDLDVTIGQDVVHKHLEIPSAVNATGASTVQYDYPQLKRRSTVVNQPYSYDTFSLAAYKAFLQSLVVQYGGFRLRSATFIITQVESNLYKYYNVVNGFQDPYSIRMDQPDFTNIIGGVGVFGAMVEDSVTVDLH